MSKEIQTCYEPKQDSTQLNSRSQSSFSATELTRTNLMNLGYAVVPAVEGIRLSNQAQSEWNQFQKSWDLLPKDRFMSDGGNYRYRRFAAFTLVDNGSEISLMREHKTGFYQSASVNKLNGGRLRIFAEMETPIATSSVLKELIADDLKRLPLYGYIRRWSIMVHQIRTVATHLQEGLATPEGIHRDGHLYVAQHLVRRVGVDGGTSRIFDANETFVASHLLTQPLDTIILDDIRMRHFVDPFGAEQSCSEGFRDMLLIDFNIEKGVRV
jgi:hypothetical protein